jgi:hypothetical protein
MSRVTSPETRAPIPAAVWWVVAIWTCLLASWALLLPIYRSADEPWHVDAAKYIGKNAAWPGLRQMRLQQDVWRSLRYVGLSKGPYAYSRLLEKRATPRDQRPSFSEIGGDLRTGTNNQMTQHPPAYYILAAGAMAMIPASVHFDLVVLFLRMMGVLLMVMLPLLIALSVRRLGGNQAAMTVGAMLPLCIPQLAATSGGVNNDSLLNISSAIVLLGVVLVATGDLRLRTAGWLGLALALALFTKAWALLLVPFVGLAYLVAAGRSQRWMQAFFSLGFVGSLATLGGWWWLANLVQYGTLQPAGHFPPLLTGPLSFAEYGGEWLEVFAKRLPTRFWATLSIKPGNPFPLWLSIGASIVLLAGAFWMFVRQRTFRANRIDAILLCGPFLLALGVLMRSTWLLFARFDVTAGIQGRYLYFSLVGIATAFALAVVATASDRWRRWLPVVLWLVFVTYAGAAQLKVLTFHWGSKEASFAERWAALLAWSPAPPVAVWWVFTMLLAASAALLLVLLRDALRSHEAAPVEPRRMA